MVVLEVGKPENEELLSDVKVAAQTAADGVGSGGADAVDGADVVDGRGVDRDFVAVGDSGGLAG